MGIPILAMSIGSTIGSPPLAAPPPSPPSVGVDVLLRLSNEPNIVIVVVRPRSCFLRAHIPGSHTIPAGLLLAGEPPVGDLLIVGADSRQAVVLIEQLHTEGYNRKIRYLDRGFQAWLDSQQSAPPRSSGAGWSRWYQNVGAPTLVLVAWFTQSLGLLGLAILTLVVPRALSYRKACC